MTSILLVWLCVVICACATAFMTRGGFSGGEVHKFRMVHISEPLSTYSLSSLPFTIRGKAVSIPFRRLPEETQPAPRLRIFRHPEEQTDSLCIPTSAYEIPILPDEEPMVLHTKRLQYAYSMVSRMVVDEVQQSQQKKLIKAFMDRDTGKLASVGVLCEMVESRRFQTGEVAYVLQGLRRVNLLAFKQRRPFLTAMVDDVDKPLHSGPNTGTSTRDHMSFADILTCEELCEDIYKDLTTILRLYKLLNHRDPTPAPGFQLFTDTDQNSDASAGDDVAGDSADSVELAGAPISSPSHKSVVAELLKARTGTPGVELPLEIFRNRPIAAVEYTRDQLAEMHRYGEELLAQLTAMPQQALQGPASESVSVTRKFTTSAGDSVEVVSNAKAPTTRLTRLRMLAATAMKRAKHLLRMPGKRLDKMCRATVRLLLQVLPTQRIAGFLEPTPVVPAPPHSHRSSREPLDLALPAGSAMAAMVQRMCAEVRTTQDNMRIRLHMMTGEVEAMSALLQYVEDRAQEEAQEKRLAQELDQGLEQAEEPVTEQGNLESGTILSPHQDPLKKTGSTFDIDAMPSPDVDLTPLLQRHEAFSHAMCLPTASRDPQQLQLCIEMDTLTRLRTVASAVASDKEHLIQHALADSLLTRRDVYELEDVDLGNDLDVRCYHEVNITHAVFVGMEDMQTQDTITSVPVTTAKELILDDRVLSMQQRVAVNASNTEGEPPDQPRTVEMAGQLGAPAWRSTLLNHINDKHVNTANVEGVVAAEQDVHSSFFAVDGTFLQ